MGKKPALIGVGLAALISFAACEYASRYAPSANFFLLPTRAWELLVGSLCAFAHLNHPPKKNDALALIGLGLIGAAVFLFNEHMRLPSASMLAPVLGTALVLLFATNDTIASRLLSWRPVVAVGLVSYSAYLWHHPLFAFAHIRSFNTPSVGLMLGLSALALLLGALTWKYVEQPFRLKTHPRYVANRPALLAAVAVALLLLAAGVHGHLTQGRLAQWTENAPENQRRAFALIDHERARNFDFDNGDCIFNANSLTPEVGERIVACAKKYGKGIAVTGDSHAMNMFHLLKVKIGTRPFMVGLGQGMCRAYAPLPTCNYDKLQVLLRAHSNLFHTIIYEQAGWHLFVDARGSEIDQDMISGLPLDARVPDFATNKEHVNSVISYLKTLAPHARIIWLGPRLEPEINEHAVIHLGCDYPFALRPNQVEIFAQLDDAIEKQVSASGLEYRSQIDSVKLDMAKDFMTCDVTYWKDRNHYSEAGEKRFGARLTLDGVLKHGQ